MRSPMRPTPDMSAQEADRFWAKVDKSGSCWVWTAGTSQGYGLFQIGRSQFRAHRLAYKALVGEIPDGLVIDHICRNRACVKPEHLRATTDRENVLIGVGATAMNARKTHCKHGHELTPDNTYAPPSNPHFRYCRICINARWEPMTEAEKSARPQRPLKTHCKNGHEFTPENTYTRPGSSHRTCRACNKAAAARYASKSLTEDGAE